MRWRISSWRNNMRGQVSVEFLSVVIIFLLMITPVFLYFYSMAPEQEYQVALYQAEKVAKDILDHAGVVWVQGSGTTLKHRVALPKYTDSVQLKDNYVIITLKYKGDEVNVVMKGPVRFEKREITGSGERVLSLSLIHI